MSKETKYLGSLKKVKIHPIKKSVVELATVGLRLNSEQMQELLSMLAEAIEQGAQSLVLTAHRRDNHLTVLSD